MKKFDEMLIKFLIYIRMDNNIVYRRNNRNDWGIQIMLKKKEYIVIWKFNPKDIFNEENVKFWHWSLRNLDLDNCVTDRDFLVYHENREVLKNLIELYYELFY